MTFTKGIIVNGEFVKAVKTDLSYDLFNTYCLYEFK